MYRVVLADDERIIVQGLQKLINWENLSLNIVGVAYDGEQLSQLIESLHPDIVVSDIRMPKKSGLDVIEAWGEITGGPRFIFISGFEEFSFAKKALSFGAVDYLLKPVMERDLEKALKKAVAQLNDQSTAEIFKEDRDQMQEFFQTINNGYEYAEQELYDRFKEADLHPESHFFVAICFGISTEKKEDAGEVSFEKAELKRFVVYNAIQESFLESNAGFLTDKDNRNCNIMAMLPLSARDNFVNSYVLPKKAELEKAYQVKLLVGVGSPVADLTMLKRSYKAAKLAYELLYFQPEEVIVFDEIHHTFDVTTEDFAQKMEELLHSFVTLDSHLLEQMGQMMETIKDMNYGNRYAAVNRVAQCVTGISDRLDKLGMYPDSLHTDCDRLIEQVRQADTYEEVSSLLLDYYRGILPEVEKNAGTRKNEDIMRARAYIKEHYMEDIGLQDIAEVACMSQYYFSTMFKKVTGENYKAYLTRIRMEKALDLVINSDLKSYEIGEQVGYHNARRFVDSFKKEYGVTPADYRK